MGHPEQSGPELCHGASALAMVSAFVTDTDRGIGMELRLAETRGLSLVVCPNAPDIRRPYPRLRWSASLVQTASHADGVEHPFTSPIIVLPELCLPPQAPNWSRAPLSSRQHQHQHQRMCDVRWQMLTLSSGPISKLISCVALHRLGAVGSVEETVLLPVLTDELIVDGRSGL
jgi:hypothetical protein